MAGESTLFQEQWDARVIHVYQSKGYLTKGMSMGPMKIIGKKLHFPIFGKGEAQNYTVRDQVKKMNLLKGEVTIDADEWDAADDIYDYELDRMAANIKDATVEACAMALGRKHDVVLYDKMRAFDFNTAGQMTGGFGAAFGPGEMLKARRALFERDVPVEDGENYCGLPPIVFDTFMSYEVFANSQWVGGELPFAQGLRKKSWQNIHFFELPIFLQTKSGTDGRFFLWHKSALGTGYTGEQLKTEWERQVSFKRWYYQSTISAGSTLIQSVGIQECRYKADAEPTFT